MNVRVVTSCTGEKSVTHARALTMEDFQRGHTYVCQRLTGLRGVMRPAEQLYAGQQHVRLMRGVNTFRAAYPGDASTGADLDLRILSAGYGLVPGRLPLAPYEATFQGMSKAEIRAWAELMGVPVTFRSAVAGASDLTLILLGDDYLEACALGPDVFLGGPTFLFCGKNAVRRLPRLDNLHPVVLTNADAKRFSCGLVALKGELGARILQRLATDRPVDVTSAVRAVLETSEAPVPAATSRRERARAKPNVDQVISLPASWHQKPHRGQFQYFMPEWNDLVDRKAKQERINRLGAHRYFRVPREFPIMGDCGAFSYLREKTPPYTTDEILDYYTRLGLDLGVSIDHLIVTAVEAEKQDRYALTIENAAAFLKAHRAAGLPWTPVGAVQGWDPASYAAAAEKCVSMGYDYIALGGLTRASTREILAILQRVHDVVPARVRIHLFGIARLAAMKTFVDLGVRSADSTSFLRRAWLGQGQNYLSVEGKFYSAIRVPEAGRSFRAKRMVSEGRSDTREVERLDALCMTTLARFNADACGIEETLDVLETYDQLISADRRPMRDKAREVLTEKPWRACPCAICQRDGIHVVIFRGNNRNRRRGFHNTYVFYRLLQHALAGERYMPRGFDEDGPESLPADDAEVA